MQTICFSPIGVISSPFKKIEGMPIQGRAAEGVPGKVQLAPEFEPGLRSLEGFSHLILLYHFHMSNGYALEIVPFLDDRVHGVFATRAPRRPNPIGLSIVRLISIEGPTLLIQDVDIVDGTPVLDIKPYVPEFDVRQVERIGWLSGKAGRIAEIKSDARFK